jgi:TatD DNase family protein
MTEYSTIDFGCNYGDLSDEMLKKVFDESPDTTHIVSISNCINECTKNLKLAEKDDRVYFTLGVHPHHASEFKDSDLIFLEKYLSHPKCFGIGECGLDFNRNWSPKDDQIYAFEKQIELAKRLNKKLYLHCRDAFPDFIAIIKKYQYYEGIVHCFTGTIEQALEFTNLGFKLGITGWLLDNRRNADLIKVIQDEKIKLNMLIVETDAPYMAIKPKRKSSPSDIKTIIKTIAKLKDIDVTECGSELYEVANKFLNIGKELKN